MGGTSLDSELGMRVSSSAANALVVPSQYYPSAVAQIKGRGASTSKSAQLGQAARALRLERISPATMTPDDIVKHLHKYARSHGRTSIVVEGVTYLASPSALTGRLAGLRQLFNSVSRSGSYQASSTARLGNPAEAPAVVEYCSGYHQMYFDHGIDAKAAVPFTQGALFASANCS
jgi:hypothetical protein